MKPVTVETEFFSLKVVSTGYYWSPVSDHGTNQAGQSEQHTKGGPGGLCQHNVKHNGLSIFGEKCAVTIGTFSHVDKAGWRDRLWWMYSVVQYTVQYRGCKLGNTHVDY